MACFHPRPGWLPLDGGRMIFRSPVGENPFDYVMGMARCRKCIGCVHDRARDVSIRAMHEARVVGTSCFLTLSYAPGHVPRHGSLCRDDMKAFMFRLRTHLRRKHGAKVRAYYCGEYGERTLRPHYHAILYGWDFSQDRVPTGSSKHGHPMFTSRLLDELWGHGMCWVNHMGQEVAQYAAKYALKAQGKGQSDWVRHLADGSTVPIAPPFDSLPHGRALGVPMLEQWWGDVFPRGVVVLRGGVELPAPSAYMSVLKARDPEMHSWLAQRRAVEGLVRLEDFMPARLESREVCALARVGQSVRDAW